MSFTDYIKKMLTGQSRSSDSADQSASQTTSQLKEKTSPTLLAIDTASTSLSTAVLINGEVKGELFENMERGQAEHLMGFIAKSLEEAGIEFDAVDGIAVTVGPGAFTGMRIGLATARALGLTRKIPVVGVSSLEAVAYGVSERDQQGRNILVALDSKRNEIFAQAFDGKKRPLSAPECLAPRQALMMAPPGDTLLAGDATPRLLTAAAHAPDAFYDCTAHSLPRAGNVALIAASRWESGDNLAPVPMYLRAPDARRIEDQGPQKKK
ncbi:tRNA (adenosine(37)-N6)-threonylcarbamoyltransferase complex dimerization subunit type 1 TsaB [Thalassospira lucentensis]|uniref:tRNA (adenosine(37)-N6)-threonylcarbamoyltransferase complex dimerization subunit type 1 TsaB n=1 Tax=Thalassospira lucentensis TaxID=168935 RepID=UPI00142E873F|nr:tRNA (adenosine(37)-N6)-threonylcarbamoyltransferase complex dimerization subunit type 1 TsaB [Thalassospira lucentensis]NIZ00825.1 tRNA (adenosine(37)-N6)-threonylcarbamoyltransferase complex dimerization subunit type 1 TsaB [Thalassospira lucentensis]